MRPSIHVPFSHIDVFAHCHRRTGSVGSAPASAQLSLPTQRGAPGGLTSCLSRTVAHSGARGTGQQQDSSQRHLVEKKSLQPYVLSWPKSAVAAGSGHICGAGGVPRGCCWVKRCTQAHCNNQYRALQAEARHSSPCVGDLGASPQAGGSGRGGGWPKAG